MRRPKLTVVKWSYLVLIFGFFTSTFAVEDKTKIPDSKAEEQHFFPTFAALLSGNLPPTLGAGFDDLPPEYGGYRPRHIPYALQQANNFRLPPQNTNALSAPAATKSPLKLKQVPGILGSGNFGVIRGGTFFADDYDDRLGAQLVRPIQGGFFTPYGRPTAPHINHRPPSGPGEDFFANFRDFADIAGAKQAGSFSDFHVVYAAASSRPKQAPERPRNILEQLAKLDEEAEVKSGPKKMSKHKKKLAKLKAKEEEKVRRLALKTSKLGTEEFEANSSKEGGAEPLLALS